MDETPRTAETPAAEIAPAPEAKAKPALPIVKVQRPAIDPAEAEAAREKAGMRIYSALLGREPEVDPDAPEAFRTRRWADLTEMAEALRQTGVPAATPASVPTWRHLLEHAALATAEAGRRLDDARRRLRKRAA